MSASSWVTVLMMLLVLVVMLAMVGVVSEALGGINESGLIDR
ncbi:hypothetical protein LCGC14_1128710 [marine sediment metagenome]|uniref:Uncharacterized protein n=1 Tax=marine sediment metagenome TaxID=412755 RepID=A0A0F9M1X3_9ZZZZ